jgi:hypothetical protein
MVCPSVCVGHHNVFVLLGCDRVAGTGVPSLPGVLGPATCYVHALHAHGSDVCNALVGVCGCTALSDSIYIGFLLMWLRCSLCLGGLLYFPCCVAICCQGVGFDVAWHLLYAATQTFKHPA